MVVAVTPAMSTQANAGPQLIRTELGALATICLAVIASFPCSEAIGQVSHLGVTLRRSLHGPVVHAFEYRLERHWADAGPLRRGAAVGLVDHDLEKVGGAVGRGLARGIDGVFGVGRGGVRAVLVTRRYGGAVLGEEKPDLGVVHAGAGGGHPASGRQPVDAGDRRSDPVGVRGAGVETEV